MSACWYGCSQVGAHSPEQGCGEKVVALCVTSYSAQAKSTGHYDTLLSVFAQYFSLNMDKDEVAIVCKAKGTRGSLTVSSSL